METKHDENHILSEEAQSLSLTKNFLAGEVIFGKNHRSEGFYYLKSGLVKLVISRDSSRGRTASEDYIIKLVRPGELFGCHFSKEITMNSLKATAIQASEVLIYPQVVFHDIFNRAHPLLQRAMLQLQKDYAETNHSNQLNYLATVRERIAYQIIVLADKYGVATSDGVSVKLKLNRNELAQLAGTINESLSRHLTEFKNEGILSIRGKELIIKNKLALMEKSGNFNK